MILQAGQLDPVHNLRMVYLINDADPEIIAYFRKHHIPDLVEVSKMLKFLFLYDLVICVFYEAKQYILMNIVTIFLM